MKETESNARRFSPSRFAKEAAIQRRKRIRFLIELCELQVETLATSPRKGDRLEGLMRPGDVLNLADDIIQFGLELQLRSPDEDPHQMVERFARQIQNDPRGMLGPLVGEVRKLLAAVVDRRRYGLPVPKGSTLEFDSGFLSLLQTFGRFFGRKLVPNTETMQMMCTLRTPATDPRQLMVVFLFNALQLLNSEQGMMIRRCTREGCNRIFLAERPKQIYCSRRCASASTLAAYRQEIGEEEFKARHRASALKSWHSVGAIRRRKRKKLNGK